MSNERGGASVADGGRARTRFRAGPWIRDVAVVIVLALVASALLRMFVFQMYSIPTSSMEHTLDIGDRIVVVKFDTQPKRGDIIVFEDRAHWLTSTQPQPGPFRRFLEIVGFAPDSTHGYLVKRFIGMPGDTVACCDAAHRLTVNGYPLDERTYLPGDASGQVAPSTWEFRVVVPAGRVFVMGDNRGDSADSRCHFELGIDTFVALDAIAGPVKMTALPPTRARSFTRPSTFDGVPAASAPAPAQPSITPATLPC